MVVIMVMGVVLEGHHLPQPRAHESGRESRIRRLLLLLLMPPRHQQDPLLPLKPLVRIVLPQPLSLPVRGVRQGHETSSTSSSSNHSNNNPIIAQIIAAAVLALRGTAMVVHPSINPMLIPMIRWTVVC